MTVSARASGPFGVTSPMPSVKSVVPLMYRSTQKPPVPCGTLSREPSPHCSIAKPTMRATAQQTVSARKDSGPKMARKFSRLRPRPRRRETAVQAGHVVL